MSSARIAVLLGGLAVVTIGLVVVSRDDPTAEMGEPWGPGYGDEIPIGVTPGSAVFPHDRCMDGSHAVDVLDVDTAATAPTIEPDLTVGTLGHEGALRVALSIELPDLLCDREPSSSVVAALAEVDLLVADGPHREAEDRLRALLGDILGAPGVTILAAGPDLAALGGTDAAGHTRDSMAVADTARAHGFDDLAGDADAAAGAVYSESASEALAQADDWTEALAIMLDADVLGLTELADRASERATEMLGEIFDAETSAFDPCTATEDEIAEWALLWYYAHLLGVPGTSQPDHPLYDTASDKFHQARDVLAGEEVPECGSWAIELRWTPTAALEDGERGDFVWSGEFTVSDDGIVAGAGTGTVGGFCEGGAVSGSFTFSISGSRDGDELHLRLSATEVAIAGAEECNHEFAVLDFHGWLGGGDIVVPAATGESALSPLFELEPVEITITAGS